MDKSSVPSVILSFSVMLLYTWASCEARAFSYTTCSKANSNFRVVLQNLPPYVIPESWRKNRSGLLHDFVHGSLIYCFRQHNCNKTKITQNKVLKQDDLISSIHNETADIAFPIEPSLPSLPTEGMEASFIDSVTLVGVIKSPGFAMVIDYNACKEKVEKLTTDTILSAWPICAAMLLLAGISGISIWALVSNAFILCSAHF